MNRGRSLKICENVTFFFSRQLKLNKSFTRQLFVFGITCRFHKVLPELEFGVMDGAEGCVDSLGEVSGRQQAGFKRSMKKSLLCIYFLCIDRLYRVFEKVNEGKYMEQI